MSDPYFVRLHSGLPGVATAVRMKGSTPPGGGALGLFSAEQMKPDERWLGMPPVVYEDSVLATDEPFLFTAWGRDDDDRLMRRWIEARMGMDPKKITATLDKPSGVPLGWAHDVGWIDSPAPVGRIMTMAVEGGELKGDVEVSPAQLGMFMPNSVDDLPRLVGGLSIGFFATEPPTLERKSGTRDDPDQMVYGAYRVFETSLVPIPALPGAGLGRRVVSNPSGNAGMKEDEENE